MREIRNEEKRTEREVNGKAKKSLFIAAILLLCGGLIQATPVDANIYSDAVIEDGDEYGTVNIYDTPPDQTTITMTGGEIIFCKVFDAALLDYREGNLSHIEVNDFGTAYVKGASAYTFDLYGSGKVHIYNSQPISSIQIFDDAELHIYGYNLEYDETPTPNWITGQWENGQEFKVYLRNIYSYNPEQVFLHEIPEPSTLSMLGVLLLFIERRKKYKS